MMKWGVFVVYDGGENYDGDRKWKSYRVWDPPKGFYAGN
jgi:hypothetical protein